MSRGKWRWFVARNLDRLPGFCWANLVTWALGWHTMREQSVRQSRVCRTDAAANGVCYCGKLRLENGWSTDDSTPPPRHHGGTL